MDESLASPRNFCKLIQSKKGLTKRGYRYADTPEKFIKDPDVPLLKEGDRLCQNLPAFIRKETGVEKGLAIVQPTSYILDKNSTTFDIRLLEFGNVISKAEGTKILNRVIKAQKKKERKLEQIRFTGSIRYFFANQIATSKSTNQRLNSKHQSENLPKVFDFFT